MLQAYLAPVKQQQGKEGKQFFCRLGVIPFFRHGGFLWCCRFLLRFRKKTRKAHHSKGIPLTIAEQIFTNTLPFGLLSIQMQHGQKRRLRLSSIADFKGGIIKRSVNRGQYLFDRSRAVHCGMVIIVTGNRQKIESTASTFFNRDARSENAAAQPNQHG